VHQTSRCSNLIESMLGGRWGRE